MRVCVERVYATYVRRVRALNVITCRLSSLLLCRLRRLRGTRTRVRARAHGSRCARQLGGERACHNPRGGAALATCARVCAGRERTRCSRPAACARTHTRRERATERERKIEREGERKGRKQIEARQTQGAQRETRTDGAANDPWISMLCRCVCVHACA